jgi:hypothetical protein
MLHPTLKVAHGHLGQATDSRRKLRLKGFGGQLAEEFEELNHIVTVGDPCIPRLVTA